MQNNKFIFEKKYQDFGFDLIAGVDEVGRGPLAGPVVCAAVIMPKDDIIEGIDDSKKLSEKKRIMLDKLIREKAISYAIIEVSEEVIDEINILNATKLCMKNAIENLKIVPQIVLTDAVKIDVKMVQENIIKGDSLSYSIGCASIIAKVYRDNLMTNLASNYPEYGFEKHKGYGTAYHISKIKEFGECKCHRKSFIKNILVTKAKN